MPRGRALTGIALAGVAVLVAAAAQAPTLAQPAAEAFPVVFVVNDAGIKDSYLENVAIEIETIDGDAPAIEGATGSDGRFETRLAPGDYRVSYRSPGWITVETETAIHRSDQVITTSLSRRLEDEIGAGRRRIRIVLNWGSDEDDQVRDADSHLRCTCEEPGHHVYYAAKQHEGAGHRVELDVDDMDWGGPETITVLDPVTGRYLYWIHDYSDGPGALAGSDVVVRVLWDDQVLTERRMPAGEQKGDARYWRPFAALEVNSEDEPPAVLPFSLDEIQAGQVYRAPAGYETTGAPGGGCGLALVGVPIVIVWLGIVILAVLRRKR